MNKIHRTVAVCMFVGLAGALAGCGNDKTTTGVTGAVTFWQNVAPIYNQRCVRCHQQGGIGPFRLDNYADAKLWAPVELRRVMEGTMPPYFMVHDGSCGSFHDETTLTAAEKATIAAWVNGDQGEGTPVTLALPDRPVLMGAEDVSTPTFAPVAQGGQLAEFDDYRCFLVSPPLARDAYLTGYDVSPGEPAIVHHLLAFIVDPAQPGEPDPAQPGQPSMTNGQIMQALDDESPDRLGWPCFGGAGERVNASGLPVTWAPGQGIVNFPAGMGAAIKATDRIVIQMHYNLADPAVVGKTDSTTVHLKFSDRVDRQLAFALPDPFLESLNNDPPDMLPPRQADATYTWTQSGRQLGIDGIPYVDLVAVMPHMHGRGLRQHLRIGSAGNLACAGDLENWSFHWQEFYFYKTLPRLTPDSEIQVSCEYDTSSDASPVLPGWGTRNEMCMTVMMVALPPQ